MREIVYAGNMQCFQATNVRNHPQFKHISFPPKGYKFIEAQTLREEKLAITLKKALGLNLDDKEKAAERELSVRRTLLDKEIDKLVEYCYTHQISEETYLRFLRLLDIDGRGDESPIEMDKLKFLPSYLFDLQASPFVVEIEDVYTLFWPFIANGENMGVDIIRSEYFRLVQYLLARPECMCILTHVHSTVTAINNLFGPEIGKKAKYIQMGVPPIAEKCSTYLKPYGKTIRLLFTSSWGLGNFEVRGGLDTLVAFDKLCEKYSNIELILKCRVSNKIPKECWEILKRRKNKIHIISGRLSDPEMDKLMRSVDIFLLPAARIHIISLLNAMAYGIPVIASDGWGIREYVEDGNNGSIVQGRYGKASWEDERGVLRENYKSMHTVDDDFVDSLMAKIEELLLNDEYRFHITKNAMNDIGSRYSLQQWNHSLGLLFDECYKQMGEKEQRGVIS